MPSARGQRGTHKGGLRPPLSLPPLKIPLLKLPAVRSGKFVRLFRLCMNRAERMCKLSVCIKIRGFVRPSASVHQSRGTYSPTSASQHFRLKEKEEGFPKGGTLVHLFGSVPKARPAQGYRFEIYNPDTHISPRKQFPEI